MIDYVKNNNSQRFGERRDERWQTGSSPIRRVGERAFDSSSRLSGRGKREDKIRSPGLRAGALMAGNGSGGAIGYRASAFGLQE
jgi:hypothetical protein